MSVLHSIVLISIVAISLCVTVGGVPWTVKNKAWGLFAVGVGLALADALMLIHLLGVLKVALG